MTTGYDSFRAFVALRLHFNSNYDITKHNGRVKLTYDAFEKRPDAHIFNKFAKTYGDVHHKVLLANFAYSPIGHIVEVEHSRYAEWIRRRESLSYLVKKDLSIYSDITLDELISADRGHPPLFKGFLGGRVMIETVALLDHEFHFIDSWNNRLNDDFIWKSVGFHLAKFRLLIKRRSKMVTDAVDTTLKPY